MGAEQVFIVSEGAIESRLVFSGCLTEAPGRESRAFAESLYACGNGALRGRGRGVSNNGGSQGYS